MGSGTFVRSGKMKPHRRACLTMLLARAVFGCVLLLLLSRFSTNRAGADIRLLPHATVELDGQPADIGPIGLELDSYLVPLDKVVTALTHGHATLDVSRAQFARVLVDGKLLIQLPTDEQ